MRFERMMMMCKNYGRRENSGIVLRDKGRKDVLPDPWIGKNVFHENGAGDKPRDNERRQGDDRNHRISQSVLEKHRSLFQPLCPGCADVIGAHDVQHGTAQDPDNDTKGTQSERHRRKDDVQQERLQDTQNYLRSGRRSSGDR